MEENNLNVNETNRAEAPAAAGNPYLQGNAAAPAGDPFMQTGPAPARVKPARTRFETEKADLIFACVSAALTLFGVIAGLWGGARLGFAIAFLLNFFSVSIYLGQKKQFPNAYGTLCGVLAVLLTPGFALTSNGIVRFFSAVGAAVLSVLWFASLAGRRTPAGDLGLAAAFGAPVLDSPGSLALTFRGFFSGSERMKRTAKVLLGILCAVPVLCAVIPLLISSDAAFEGLLQTVFADFGTAAAQLAVAVLLLPLIVSFSLALRKTEKQPAAPKESRGLDTAFVAAFFGALSVSYLLYMGSQLAYFFNAFKGLLPEGYSFSYAEYARRGFFELCAVAAINLVLIFAAVLFSRKKDGKLPAVLRAFGTFISLFTLLLIGIALAKMALYIQNYGMTVLRLGVSAFCVFMAAVFLAVLLRLYVARVSVLHVAAAAAAAVLIVLGVGNVNGFAAKYNYEAYAAGKLEQIDVAYLGQLKPESVPYLIRLAENENEDAKTRRAAALELYYAGLSLYESKYTTEDQANFPDDPYDVDFDYTSYYRWPLDEVIVTPVKRLHTGFAKWSLPQKTAYEALEAFFAAHPDFIRGEPKAHNASGGERGYFDAEEPTTAPPAQAAEAPTAENEPESAEDTTR